MRVKGLRRIPISIAGRLVNDGRGKKNQVGVAKASRH